MDEAFADTSEKAEFAWSVWSFKEVYLDMDETIASTSEEAALARVRLIDTRGDFDKKEIAVDPTSKNDLRGYSMTVRIAL